MPYRSKLFNRNNGGRTKGTYFKKPYPARARIAISRANPRPPKSAVSKVNTAESKHATFTDASIICRDTGNVALLDIITQGTAAGNRLGQKYRTTGIHIKGTWKLPVATLTDNPGYMLVWDRQPNETLANPADIMIGGTDSSRSFPNSDNLDRFVFLARKHHTSVNQNNTGDQTTSSEWTVDDYYDFSDKRLIATNVVGGSGLIGDRSSGALLIFGTGQNVTAISSSLQFNYRIYFEDV